MSCIAVMVKCGGPNFLWMPQNKLKIYLLPNPLLMRLGMRGEGYRHINYSLVGWSWFVMIYLYFWAHDLTEGSHFLFYSKAVRQRSSAGRPQRRLVQFQFVLVLLRRKKRLLKCRRLKNYMGSLSNAASGYCKFDIILPILFIRCIKDDVSQIYYLSSNRN